MILLLLSAAVLVSTAAPAPAVLAAETREISQAIDAGRLEQAKLMISRAIRNGDHGEAIDRLVADLSFASARHADALGQYKALLEAGVRAPGLCEKGVIVALKLAQLADARAFAACALAAPEVSWRAWNACGVIADLEENWAKARDCYGKAHALAPGEAAVVNNQGWSRLMSGDWVGALPFFEQAAKLDPDSTRIANNLELARSAVGADLPSRRTGESAHDWAARLNDAGVAAQLLGDKRRALAAFTQALYANENWYERAANNLEIAAKP